MSGMSPRGPLPAGVYWRRRALVLLVAVILVLFLVKLIGGGSDAESDKNDAATPVAANHDPEVTTTAAAEPTGTAAATTGSKPRKTKTPLAEPDGPCDAADVKIGLATQRVANDGEVELVLALTGSEAACTFTVSPDSVALKIVSGSDNIWFSQHCPAAVPTADVVVRSAVAAKVPMTWNGHRSDPECSRATEWADVGYYHLVAAAFGGDPTDTQFELTRPGPVTITKTAEPEQKKRD